MSWEWRGSTFAAGTRGTSRPAHSLPGSVLGLSCARIASLFAGLLDSD